MFGKQLLFRLGLIALILSSLSIIIFKVDEISMNITRSSVQGLLEPLFFIDGQSEEAHISYEMVDPMVTVLDTGDMSIESNITLSSGLDQEWGKVVLLTTLFFDAETKSFYLKLAQDAKLKIAGKSSSDADFHLWNKDIAPLITAITAQLNAFLEDKELYSLHDKELRIQAEDLSIRSITKTESGVHIVMDVRQSISIIITYFIMFLGLMIIIFAYFFIGKVGFKDDEKLGFRDPHTLIKRK